MRPELYCTGDWLFLHDNALTDTFLFNTPLSSLNSVAMIRHSSCSLDMASKDFLHIPRVKIAMKGRCFEDIEAIQKKVTISLQRRVSPGRFSRSKKGFEDIAAIQRTPTRSLERRVSPGCWVLKILRQFKGMCRGVCREGFLQVLPSSKIGVEDFEALHRNVTRSLQKGISPDRWILKILMQFRGM